RCYRDWSSDVCSSDLFGLDARTQRRKLKSRIGVVPQEENLDDELTVVENLRQQALYHGVNADGRIDELLRGALLEQRADASPRRSEERRVGTGGKLRG